MDKLFLLSLCVQTSVGFTSSEYALDSEYTGTNFFQGWDFFTGADPTGGYVSFYDGLSAQDAGLVNVTANGQVYIGMDYTTTLPKTTTALVGAGRPSIRISTQRNWTHGLFIGDFAHVPGGVCGTWPAFWSLGPNWPFTGEIDILEGVNMLTQNAMTLHTNATCVMNYANNSQSGVPSGDPDCAYYNGDNLGCGVTDPRTNSYGADFNENGGGVYAMQWTSNFINIWFFIRDQIPPDITSQQPNPSGWGIPAASFQGGAGCTIDDHFQQHSVVFDNTLCGSYAGVVWDYIIDGTPSCQSSTGYADCPSYVAAHPEAFQESYWLVNSVRVYQLVDPATDSTDSTPYVASLQPTTSNTATATAATVTPTASLCPTYNFTVVEVGGSLYEIECRRNPPGFDLGPPTSTYSVHSFEDCVAGCNLWNVNNGSDTCVGVAYNAQITACYWKYYIYDSPYAEEYNGARLIYFGYPRINDLTIAPLLTWTSTSVSPQTYLAVPITSSTITTTAPFTSTSGNASIGEPGLGQTVSVNGTAVVVVTNNSTITQSALPTGGVLGHSTTAPTGMTATSTNLTAVIPTSFSTPTNTGGQSVSSSIVSSSTTTTTVANSTQSSLPPYFSSLPFFYITVVGPPGRISPRQTGELEYVSFDDGNSFLTTDQADAALFQVDNGTLVTGGQYVVAGDSPNESLFSLSPTPSNSTLLSNVTSSNGSLNFGNSTVCKDASGNFFFSNGSCPSYASPATIAPYTTTPSFLSTSSTSMTTRTSGSFSIPTTPALPTITTTTSQGYATSSSTRSTTTTPTGPITITYTQVYTTPGSMNTGSTTSTYAGTTTTSAVSSGVTLSTSLISGSASSSTMSASVDPAVINNFHYVGCRSFTGPQMSGFTLKANSSTMSVELCISSCANSSSAGLYSSYCYCGNALNATMSLQTYPESSCTIPCPGSSNEICGGLVTTADIGKRQLAGAGEVLINLYTNTLFAGTPTTSLLMSTPSTSAPLLSTASSASSSPVMQPVVVSTVYVDVCNTAPFSMTTLATTVTVMHCGCTESVNEQGATVFVAPAAVPMTTTVKSCGCGEGGAPSSRTVTVPCTSAIEAASANVAAITTPSTSGGSGVGSGASVTAAANPAAPASAGTSASASAVQPNQPEPPAMTGALGPAPGIPMAGNTTNPSGRVSETPEQPLSNNTSSLAAPTSATQTQGAPGASPIAGITKTGMARAVGDGSAALLTLFAVFMSTWLMI